MSSSLLFQTPAKKCGAPLIIGCPNLPPAVVPSSTTFLPAHAFSPPQAYTMTHTVDIPPPKFAGHPEPLDGAKTVAAPAIPPLRPPPYRRTLPTYLSRTRTYKDNGDCRICLCCCCTALLLIVFIFASVLLYIRFTIEPQVPSYRIQRFDVKRLEVFGGAALVVDVAITMRAENPDEKFAIRYRNGGRLAMSYLGMGLGAGELPTFHQAPGSAREVVVAVRGRRVVGERKGAAMLAGWRSGKEVPLELEMRAPAGLALGQMDLAWVTVFANCTMNVNGLKPGKMAKIKSSKYTVMMEI